MSDVTPAVTPKCDGWVEEGEEPACWMVQEVRCLHLRTVALVTRQARGWSCAHLL